MQKLPKIFLVLGIVAVVLIIGGFIGWLAGGSGAKNPAPVNPATAESHSSVTAPPVHSTATVAENLAHKNTLVPDGDMKITASFPPGVITNWEDKVDEILGANIDDTNKVEQLFALFPHVPAESKSEVAQHLSNLVPDENYAPLGELLKDPSLSDDTLDVLMQDVLGRPNSLKLPALLEVAQVASHPKADEAKDFLSLFLEEEFGDDWAKWHDKMVAWLKDNPD